MSNTDRFKFRVWDKDNKKYVKCEQWIGEEIEPGYYDDSGCPKGHVNCVIEQCTGLKDKNRKLIFEGDEIRTIALNNDHNQKGATQVVTVKNYMGNSYIYFNDSYSGVTLYPFNVIHTIEIIGTIHDAKGEVC